MKFSRNISERVTFLGSVIWYGSLLQFINWYLLFRVGFFITRVYVCTDQGMSTNHCTKKFTSLSFPATNFLNFTLTKIMVRNLAWKFTTNKQPIVSTIGSKFSTKTFYSPQTFDLSCWNGLLFKIWWCNSAGYKYCREVNIDISSVEGHK